MGRVINPDSGGKQRTLLKRYILCACRAFDPEHSLEEIQDISAFIYLALLDIDQSINNTARAWENRGYWVKADKFRLAWLWVISSAIKFKDAIESADWKMIAILCNEVVNLHYHDKESTQSCHGQPWEGAWYQYRKLKNSRKN